MKYPHLLFALLALSLVSVSRCWGGDDDDDGGYDYHHGNSHFMMKIPSHHPIHFDNTRDKDICIIAEAPRDKPYHAIQFDTLEGDGYAEVYVLWGIPVGKDVSEYLNTTAYPGGVIDNCYHHAITHNGPADYVAVGRKGLKPAKLPNQYGYPMGNISNIAYFVLEITLHSPQPNVTIYDDAGMSIRMTKNLRPKHAGMWISGIETSFLTLPPYQPNMVLHNYVPNHAPYALSSSAVSMDKMFERTMGSPVRLILGLGHTNHRGKEVSSWIWKNGTVPLWTNVTRIMERQNLTNPFGDAPQGPIGEPQLIHHTSKPNTESRWKRLDDAVFHPGDAYSVQCVWSTMNEKEDTLGNFMTIGEMCNFVGFWSSDYVDPSQSMTILSVDIFHHYLFEPHGLNPFNLEHAHH